MLNNRLNLAQRTSLRRRRRKQESLPLFSPKAAALKADMNVIQRGAPMDPQLAFNGGGAAVRVRQVSARSSDASPVCVKARRTPSFTGYARNSTPPRLITLKKHSLAPLHAALALS